MTLKKSYKLQETEAVERLTGKMYCSTNQHTKDSNQGSYVMIRGCRRWMCFACQDARKNRPHKTD